MSAINRISWLLVSDEHVARVFAWQPESHALNEIEVFYDPTARMSEKDLHRDTFGRRAGGGGTGAGPMHGKTSAGPSKLRTEAMRFARQVTEWLQQARLANRFDELKVVAAPRFLGLLRECADPRLWQTVSESEDKDLVHDDPRELAERFFRVKHHG